MTTDTDFAKGQVLRVYTMLRNNPTSLLGLVLLVVVIFSIGFFMSFATGAEFSIAGFPVDSGVGRPLFLCAMVAVGLWFLLVLWLMLRVQLVVYEYGLELRGAY